MIAALTATLRVTSRLIVSVVVCLLAVIFAQPTSAAPTELLSIEGFPVAQNQFVDKFEIWTWGVVILAVCHLPPAWRLRADPRRRDSR